MKKILLLLIFMSFTLCLTACDPTSTEASMNTNLTQTTTATATTTTNNYVAVTHIELIVSQAEVCVGNQINLTVNITPSNATNQNYTITLSTTTMVDFVNPANQLLLEAFDDHISGEIGETIVTATSDDNPSIDDTQGIYVHPTGGGVC